ncbi:MAG: RagB/SusD family nutrient uptake outer membrane protein [Hymenobacter sp.]|nr:MAG: RagB/SusD family nutrient uptake outer membrane protein [Hymenobacter sp.]
MPCTPRGYHRPGYHRPHHRRGQAAHQRLLCHPLRRRAAGAGVPAAGQLPAAAAAANRVIAANRYQLNTSYGDNFLSNNDLLGNSPEDIFAIQVSSQSGINQLNTFYSQYIRADREIQPQFISLLDADDDRANLYEDVGGTVYTNKYDVLYGNVKIMRLDEMYLIRAAASFRANTSTGAAPLDDINTIRERALLPPLTTLTLADIPLELAFEGFRLGDLKRNQESTIDPLNGNAIPWNSPRLVFPIPLRETNVNSSLVQNTGY